MCVRGLVCERACVSSKGGTDKTRHFTLSRYKSVDCVAMVSCWSSCGHGCLVTDACVAC